MQILHRPNIHFILICFFLLPSALSWMHPFCNRAHPTHSRFNRWVRVKYVGIDKRHISKARRRATEASADRSQTTTSFPRMNNQESNNLENSPTLVLNADYTPLSYIPLSVWCWQDTLRAVFSGKAVVVAEYSNLLVRSVSCSFKLPSVIALKEYHKKPSSSPVMSKRYVFIRDNFRCQVNDTKAAVDTSLHILIGHVFMFACVVLFGAVPSGAVVTGSCHPAMQRREAYLDKHRVLLPVLQLS
jgi:hypothetical protein